MMVLLVLARTAIAVLIIVFVGLAFLPHFAAERLVALQNILTETIERRRRSDRGR